MRVGALPRFALAALCGALLGAALATCGGCAAERVVTVPRPIFVAPDCEPENMLQRCQIECLEQHGKRAIEAVESATQHWCVCAPFAS